MPTLNLHPKVQAALLAAVGVGIVTLANAAANVYPNNTLVLLLVGFAPVVAGYLKRAPAPPPKIVVAPQAPSTFSSTGGTAAFNAGNSQTITFTAAPKPPASSGKDDQPPTDPPLAPAA